MRKQEGVEEDEQWQEKTFKYEGSLTTRQENFIDSYVNDGESINRGLRSNGIPAGKLETFKAADEMIQHGTISQDIMVYRGIAEVSK